MNKKIHSRISVVFLLVFTALLMQFCKAPQHTTAVPLAQIPADQVVSYEKNIMPIVVRSCSPCHFPEEGNKKMLNTYEAVRDNIADIVDRVQLPADEARFMPFKSKKEPLSKSEIGELKKWMAQGMPK